MGKVRHGCIDEKPKMLINEDMKNLLCAFLFAKHQGEENAITTYAIARWLGLPVTNTNQQIRKALKEMLEEGIPIVTSAKGVFYAADTDELIKYRDHINSRIMGLLKTKQAVMRIVLVRHDGNLFE